MARDKVEDKIIININIVTECIRTYTDRQRDIQTWT